MLQIAVFEVIQFNFSNNCFSHSKLQIDNQLKTMNLNLKRFNNTIFTNNIICNTFTTAQIQYNGIIFTNYNINLNFNNSEFNIFFEYPSTIHELQANDGIYVLETDSYTEIYPIESFEIVQVNFQNCFENTSIVTIQTESEICLYVEQTGCNLNQFKNQQALIFYTYNNQLLSLQVQDAASNNFQIENLIEGVKDKIFSKNMINPYLESKYYCMSCFNLPASSFNQCTNLLLTSYHNKSSFLNLQLYDKLQNNLYIETSFGVINSEYTCQQKDLNILQAKIAEDQIFIQFSNTSEFQPKMDIEYSIQLFIIGQKKTFDSATINTLPLPKFYKNRCFHQEVQKNVRSIQNNIVQLDIEFNILNFKKQCQDVDYAIYFTIEIYTINKEQNYINNCFLVSDLEIDLSKAISLVLYNNYLCSNIHLYGLISIVYETDQQLKILTQQLFNSLDVINNIYYNFKCIHILQQYELFDVLNKLNSTQVNKNIIVYYNDGITSPIRILDFQINNQINLIRNLIILPFVAIFSTIIIYLITQIDLNNY